MKKILIGLGIGIILLTSCNEEENLEKINDLTFNTIKGNYDKENDLLSFENKNDLKDSYFNVKELNEPEKEFKKFYSKGFLPLKNSGYLTESEAEVFYKKRKSNNKNDVKEDIIENEYFANFLNDKGEIKVGNKIYKYTKEGVFIVDEENKELLNNISLNKLSNKKAKSKALVEHYIPNKRKLPEFRIKPMFDCSTLEMQKLAEYEHGPCSSGGGGGGISSSSNNLSIPTNTSNYNSCHNTKDGFFDNIFGRSYACEYKFNRKKKLRTVFAAEDYLFFTDVYMQAKFKQKTWFGWFSDRSADKVYIKNIKSLLKMKTRDIDISINGKEAKEVYNKITTYLKKLLKEKETVSYLSGVYDLDNKNYTSSQLSYQDLVDSSNTPVFTPKKYIRKKFIDLDINFKNLFKGGANKVAVVNISGKNVLNFKSKDFYFFAGKALKNALVGLRKGQKGAVIITHFNPVKNELKPIAYFFENEIVEVRKRAIARREFDLPKKFKVDKALLTFKDNDGNSDFVLDLKFSWDILGSASIEMESGAKYRGKWGGSKFTVEY